MHAAAATEHTRRFAIRLAGMSTSHLPGLSSSYRSRCHPWSLNGTTFGGKSMQSFDLIKAICQRWLARWISIDTAVHSGG